MLRFPLKIIPNGGFTQVLGIVYTLSKREETDFKALFEIWVVKKVWLSLIAMI